jgi:hypothetical protein
MKHLLSLTTLMFSIVILSACSPLSRAVPLLLPATWQPSPTIDTASEVTLPENGDVVTFGCEVLDCIGHPVPFIGFADVLPRPQSYVRAEHEGNGPFSVRFDYDDGTALQLFEGEGIYASPTVTVTMTGMLTMTVEATGPWKIEFRREPKSLQ